ncbi:enoyl-CoA hydratase [Acrocarpospora macrocephala]|uniref:Enoyl-CoA hydratase n=1 Tax=Acrocarpospora macrocephala TaxID=150177 RepID=A0A5M3WR05_9ACTN|nr:enoyl-CoA hydratase/isomerase family protein [Acrocarpospora macrocephala]GES09721.1 enoyl-CoA hydratase [Acrocarpospora macrocephala]
MSSWVKLVVDEDEAAGIVCVTLNRPEKRNALDTELLSEYSSVLESYLGSPTIRVIVTRGAGTVFCAGMDLHDLKDWAHRWDTGEVAWSDAGPLSRAMRLLREHTCITVASVQGVCAGGGIALVVAHDLAVASDTARFILPDTARGSFGAVAAAALHFAVPTKVAFDMQLTGRELLGPEAMSLGLVSRSVPPDRLPAETEEVAAQVASRRREPLIHAKMARRLNEGRPLMDTMSVDLLVRTKQDVVRNSFSDVTGFLASRKGAADAPPEASQAIR